MTDHRMVLSLSPTSTTLWDQFQWSGNAADFAWILPIHNGPNVEVALADERFIAAMDQYTGAIIQPPPTPSRYCWSCFDPAHVPDCSAYYPSPGGVDAGAVFADAGSPDAYTTESGVVVYQMSTVGPYSLSVIGGADAMALRDWLRTNGYVIPASLEPMLQSYIDAHMDFVALRLRPSAGTQAMQPVRVTMPGAQPLLPLRMIAAGIADKVNLLLVTVSSSELEPMNFPSAALTGADLEWDFARVPAATPQTALLEAERRIALRMNSRAWVEETLSADDIGSVLRRAAPVGDAGSTPADDWAVATRGLSGTPIFTRLRSELPLTALDRDLVLTAGLDPIRSRAIPIEWFVNTPVPSACQPCTSGQVEYGYSGEIVGPSGEWLAPGASFPARYHLGDLATVTPQYRPPPGPTCIPRDAGVSPEAGVATDARVTADAGTSRDAAGAETGSGADAGTRSVVGGFLCSARPGPVQGSRSRLLGLAMAIGASAVARRRRRRDAARV